MSLYTQLLGLKHRNPALWNGRDGAPVEVLPCSSRHVFAFRRTANGSAVTVVLNLSDAAQSVKLDGAAPELLLQPWSWWLDQRRPGA
jgi:maltooligosyltrehalose synthase